MKGIVKWFNAQKGYGFIKAEDGSEVFVHYSQIKMNRFKGLDADDVVEFEIGKGTTGREQAENVLPVLTLGMMKKKAAKEHLHLEVAPTDGSGNRGWMIVDGNNFIVAGEQGMSLEELDKYFAE